VKALVKQTKRGGREGAWQIFREVLCSAEDKSWRG
jgi:hypothetical protein